MNYFSDYLASMEISLGQNLLDCIGKNDGDHLEKVFYIIEH